MLTNFVSDTLNPNLAGQSYRITSHTKKLCEDITCVGGDLAGECALVRDMNSGASKSGFKNSRITCGSLNGLKHAHAPPNGRFLHIGSLMIHKSRYVKWTMQCDYVIPVARGFTPSDIASFFEAAQLEHLVTPAELSHQSLSLG
jgi:hypothetical protein